MAGRGRIAITAAVSTVAALVALIPSAAPAAAPPPGEYRENDPSGGRVYNILPPGQNGFESAADAAAFLTDGTRPLHQADQNDMYANLVYAAPGLRRSQILDFFKDASFGVKAADRERTYTPSCVIVTDPSPGSEHCGDVTIVRDEFGVPHVYGADRAALMFGLGYITGEDRLFLADALRHAGRGNLTSFAGGGNLGQDRDTFESAPYPNDAELMKQYNDADDIYGADGVLIQNDVQNYTDGVNQWIAEARLDPVNKLDALYPATNNAAGPARWRVTDVIATGTLVAGIFGKGGGGEVSAALALQEAQERFGKRRGKQVWKDFRSADEPEAPRTVHRGKFPYRVPEGRRGLAMPDPGSLEDEELVVSSSAAPASARDEPLLPQLADISAGSNALLVSADESRGGHPTAVFGPQTGYFAPQLLMEQDAHAPASSEGPAIHARGAAFVGTNLYVQLGRGVDYSWSATSAGQDIIDTFAVKLCEPGGGTPTKNSEHYMWSGECTAMEVIEHTNAWAPSAADDTPAGTETMRMYRTKAGLVSHRLTINGKPHAYTRHRATYKREVDAAGAFADWNSPDKIKNARDFIESAFKNDLTFNWFYADERQIAYVNSGANPQRAPRTHPNFPVKAKRKFMWRGYNANLNTFKRQPLQTRPQVIDQRYLTSWNNKHARGYRCDGIRCYTSTYRVKPLDNRIKDEIRGRGRMSLVELIDAMEDAGTVDLRGDAVLPWALRVITKRRGIRNPQLRTAVRTMKRWFRSGAHRRDADDDGNYDHSEAVKIIDAWWPLWIEGEFEPVLGAELYGRVLGSLHDAPGAVGSAFNNDTYGFPHKDLRQILGKRVRNPYSRTYCGNGRLGKCRTMLRKTLKEAAAMSFEDVYGSGGCTVNNGSEASEQMCDDAVNATDVTAAEIGEFHWINRPTFQQAVQYTGGR